MIVNGEHHSQSPFMPTSEKERIRRTPEQIIADFQARIRKVEARQATRGLKQSPSARATIIAMRAIDRALDHAGNESDAELKRAVTESHRLLVEYLQAQGLDVEQRRGPHGRRAAGSEGWT